MEQTNSYNLGGNCLKGGEGISQKTYMNDLWTWTMVKGPIMEVEYGLGGGV